jgi:hypothetical protein
MFSHQDLYRAGATPETEPWRAEIMVKQERMSRGMDPATGLPYVHGPGGGDGFLKVFKFIIMTGLVLFTGALVIFAYKESESSRSHWWYNSPTRSKIINYAKTQAYGGRKLTDPAVLLSQESRVNKLTPRELLEDVRQSYQVSQAKGKSTVSTSKASAYRCQFTTECRSLAIIDGKLRFVVIAGAIEFLKQQAKAGNKNAEKDVCIFLPLAEPNTALGIGIESQVCKEAVKEFPDSEVMRKDLDMLTNSQWLVLSRAI